MTPRAAFARRALPPLAGVLVIFLAVAALAVLLDQARGPRTRTVPADGARLTEAPSTVTVTASGPVDARRSHISVLTAAGEPVNRGEPEARGATLVQPVAVTAGGAYEVGYHLTLADGHQVSGVSRFSFGAVPGGPPAGRVAEHHHGPVDPLNLAIVLLDVLLVGAAVVVMVRRPRVR